jgi:hypothetical protein
VTSFACTLGNSWVWFISPYRTYMAIKLFLHGIGDTYILRPVRHREMMLFCSERGFVWEMEDWSGWKRIEGDFEKFWLIMEIPPPQSPSFPFIPLIPKQALNELPSRMSECYSCSSGLSAQQVCCHEKYPPIKSNTITQSLQLTTLKVARVTFSVSHSQLYYELYMNFACVEFWRTTKWHCGTRTITLLHRIKMKCEFNKL